VCANNNRFANIIKFVRLSFVFFPFYILTSSSLVCLSVCVFAWLCMYRLFSSFSNNIFYWIRMAIVFSSNSTIIALILQRCLFDNDGRTERRVPSSSSSLITLMKKKFYRLTTDRPSAVVAYWEEKKGKEEKMQKRRHPRSVYGRGDSSSAAVTRPTTSVNYYLLCYKTRRRE